jgi:hypothetical protein
LLSKNSSKNHCRDNLSRNGLEKISTLSGAISYVISDQVSDDCWISWIILRDTNLNFADEISSNISCFGVDTSSKLSEHRNEGSAEAKSYHKSWDLLNRWVLGALAIEVELEH